MRVIFLDRDGVINRYPGDKNYVSSLRAFKFLPGSLSAIRELTKAGYEIFVISNQAGVAKKIYTKKTLLNMTRYMLDRVKAQGGRIRKVLYCLHTQNMNCSCRKPKDGLLRKATKKKRVDLNHSYFIGDSMRDIKAGKSFGCKTVLVLSGREKLKNSQKWDIEPDFIAKTLNIAAKNILGHRYDINKSPRYHVTS